MIIYALVIEGVCWYCTLTNACRPISSYLIKACFCWVKVLLIQSAVRHHSSCDVLHYSPYWWYYNLELLILRLFYCSKFWVEYCVLSARDSLVLAYLPGAGNGIELWYW